MVVTRRGRAGPVSGDIRASSGDTGVSEARSVYTGQWTTSLRVKRRTETSEDGETSAISPSEDKAVLESQYYHSIEKDNVSQFG